MAAQRKKDMATRLIEAKEKGHFIKVTLKEPNVLTYGASFISGARNVWKKSPDQIYLFGLALTGTREALTFALGQIPDLAGQVPTILANEAVTAANVDSETPINFTTIDRKATGGVLIGTQRLSPATYFDELVRARTEMRPQVAKPAPMSLDELVGQVDAFIQAFNLEEKGEKPAGGPKSPRRARSPKRDLPLAEHIKVATAEGKYVNVTHMDASGKIPGAFARGVRPTGDKAIFLGEGDLANVYFNVNSFVTPQLPAGVINFLNLYHKGATTRVDQAKAELLERIRAKARRPGTPPRVGVPVKPASPVRVKIPSPKPVSPRVMTPPRIPSPVTTPKGPTSPKPVVAPPLTRPLTIKPATTGRIPIPIRLPTAVRKTPTQP